MSAIDPKKGSAGGRTLVEEHDGQEKLEWLEEMVVRMRRGLGEELDHRLEFRGRANPQVKLKLALIEGDAVAWLRARDEAPDESVAEPYEAEPQVDEDLKARIVERLRKK